jgi:hypothetical protein
MNAAIETTAAIIHGLIRGFAGVADAAPTCPVLTIREEIQAPQADGKK